MFKNCQKTNSLPILTRLSNNLHTKAKQTQDRKKHIKDPQKKYRIGTISKIFYWRA